MDKEDYKFTKMRKTPEQNQILETFFKNRGQQIEKINNWRGNEINQLCRETGLKQHQVYKWYWDKKKKSQEQQQQKEVDNVMPSSKNYTMIKLKGQVVLQVPKTLTYANKIYIKQEGAISEWAINILKQQGWQIIKKQSK